MSTLERRTIKKEMHTFVKAKKDEDVTESYFEKCNFS